MKKKVVVQGLGFVGSVMALVVADSDNEYNVVGIDLPSKKLLIDKLNSGIFPINSTDKKVIDYFERVKAKKNFIASSNPDHFKDADVIIVDINLDIDKPKYFQNNKDSLKLSGFKKGIKTIAKNCKSDVLIIVETTVPPGTCELLVKPILEEEFDNRKIPHNFMIGHSYERVMPGPGYIDSIKNFYRVYSGIDKKSADATELFLKSIISTDKFPLTRLSSTTATEMAKVLENSYRAMNIAFIQEWTEFAEKAKVNLYEVLDSIRFRDTHKNIMNPGLGVGGYCLTKDSLLASWSSQFFYGSTKLSKSESAIKTNDLMPNHSYEVLKTNVDSLKKKRILLLGVSYLSGVGDTRYSPVFNLYNRIKKDGSFIVFNDPYVDYWEEINQNSIEFSKINFSNFDIIIFGCPHKYYRENNVIEKILSVKKSLFILDPFGLLNKVVKKINKIHKLKIVGRGDL